MFKSCGIGKPIFEKSQTFFLSSSVWIESWQKAGNIKIKCRLYSPDGFSMLFIF